MSARTLAALGFLATLLNGGIAWFNYASSAPFLFPAVNIFCSGFCFAFTLSALQKAIQESQS